MSTVLEIQREKVGEAAAMKKMKMFKKFYTTLPLDISLKDPEVKVGTGRRVVGDAAGLDNMNNRTTINKNPARYSDLTL